MNYEVEVIIQNKPIARDPEGETILRDLVGKGGYEVIKNVRTGKYLKLEVEAESEQQAKEIVFNMCNSLRIYNPVVHSCEIRVKDRK